jgi:hypothetical protein
LTAAVATASRISAFGREAERIASRFPTDLALMLCDGTSPAEALATAMQRHRDGDQFLVCPIMEDPLARLSRDVAQSIFAQFRSEDDRRQLFEALAFGVIEFNGSQISQQQIYTPEIVTVMREFSQTGDGLYVRSTTERARLETLFGRKRQYVAVAPVLDPTVPDLYPNADARQVVVWAPEMQAHDLCMYIYALWYMKQPAIIVCQGSIDGVPQRFVQPCDAESALREAAVIVDTQISDPGTALAFAGRGYGVVTCGSSGAHEHLQGVAHYYMHDFSSIYGSVTRARSDRRTFRIPAADPMDVLESTVRAAQPAIPENPPLVSIILITYNRPRELRNNLEALAKQTYPNYEVIVVNDCGQDVSAIVEEFSFARYICTPQNVGCCGAANYAFAQAKGEYATQVADDDRHHPNFIAGLVMALHGSHVDVAHGNVAIRNDHVLPDMTQETYGYMVDHDADHDYLAALWGSMLNTLGLLIRREAYADVGFLHETIGCAADVECYAKLSKAYDFAHFTNVVAEMSYRDNKSNLSSAVGDDLPRSIRRALQLHAPVDSALIASRIEQMVACAAEGAQRAVFFEPTIRLAEPIPVFAKEN